MGKMTSISAKNMKCDHTIEPCASGTLSIRHCHDTYEILFVVSGKGKYVVEGAEFPLKPRTLVMIRPFQYHCVEVSVESVYERYVIHFSPDALTVDAAQMFQPFLSGSEESGVFYSPDMVPESAVSVFDRLYRCSAYPEGEKVLYLRLLLSELLLHISLSSSQRIVHSEEQLGARLLRYINDYLDTDISLDRLAKRFFVSKYYLCRIFKDYSGTSIHSYINHKRVLYAKQLIESGETASGAAYRVGFGDYSAFYRAYVKVLGVPPTSSPSGRHRLEKESEGKGDEV